MTNLGAGLQRFRAALAHWGPAQYGMLAVVWLFLAIVPWLQGWRVVAVFSLPLLLLALGVLAYGLHSLLRLAPADGPQRVVEPKPGFPRHIEHPVLGTFPLSAAELLDALTLCLVIVAPDDRFEFVYDDGDLLGSHGVTVLGHVDTGPDEAYAQG